MGFKELCPHVPQNLVWDAEYCALLGYYVASIGNLVRNYHYSLNNNPEECNSYLLHSGSLQIMHGLLNIPGFSKT